VQKRRNSAKNSLTEDVNDKPKTDRVTQHSYANGPETDIFRRFRAFHPLDTVNQWL
jgi:hypothetical protein